MCHSVSPLLCPNQSPGHPFLGLMQKHPHCSTTRHSIFSTPWSEGACKKANVINTYNPALEIQPQTPAMCLRGLHTLASSLTPLASPSPCCLCWGHIVPLWIPQARVLPSTHAVYILLPLPHTPVEVLSFSLPCTGAGTGLPVCSSTHGSQHSA